VLHLSIPLVSITYAYYYGFAYFLPIVSGFISDKYLNKSISLVIGYVLMIMSQIFLFFAASLYVPSSIVYDTIILNTQNILFFTGIILLAIGMSFTNISFTNIINLLNRNESTKLKAFYIFFTLEHIGIIIGIIITTIILGNEHYELSKWIFFIFGICLIIALIAFLLNKKRFLIDNEGKSIDINSKLNFKQVTDEINLYLLTKIINKTKMTKEMIFNLKFRDQLKSLKFSLTKVEKDRLIVFFSLLVFMCIYYIAAYQRRISMVFSSIYSFQEIWVFLQCPYRHILF
jgi:dipeptide/tripeptide permease